MKKKYLFSLVAQIVFIFAFFFLSMENVEPQTVQGKEQGERRAILIGISKYDDQSLNELNFIHNDINALAATLKDIGGYRIYPFYSTDKNSEWFPSKEKLENRLVNIIKSCDKNDTILLYFSGHGVCDPTEKNKTYLIPQDADSSSIQTFVSANLLRSALHECQARHKFFFIDSCYAGGEKSGPLQRIFSLLKKDDGSSSKNDGDLEAKKNESAVDSSSGVITVASRTNNQVSRRYFTKNMSVFTYWLNEGLKGHAETSLPLKNISIQELYEFVRDQVAASNLPQDIVLLQGEDAVDDQIVTEVRPIEYKRFLDDMADLCITMIQEKNQKAKKSNGQKEEIKKIGVVPFRVDPHLNLPSNLLLTDFAKNFHAQIQKRLPDDMKNILLDYDVFIKDLSNNKVTPNNLLSENMSLPSGTDAIILGEITNVSKKYGFYAVECKVYDHRQRMEIGTSFKGIACLLPVRQAVNNGISVASQHRTENKIIDKEDSNPSGGGSGAPCIAVPVVIEKPQTPEEIASRSNSNIAYYSLDECNRVQNATNLPHPLLVPASERTFDVWIEVKHFGEKDFTKAPFYKLPDAPNDLYVALNPPKPSKPDEPGDIYRVVVKNRSKEKLGIGLRMLVDGLSTLTEIAKNNESKTDAVFAKKTNIEKMSYWLLENEPNTDYCISGFYTRFVDKSDSFYEEFQVTKASDSLAAQKGYSDQIGMITCLFYRLKETRGTINDSGTVPGLRHRSTLKVKSGVQIAEKLPPLEILTIRYASLKSLEKAGAVRVPSEAIQ